MKLFLSIDLGNDAMQTYGGISKVVASVSKKLQVLDGQDPEEGDAATVVDTNGNRVGRWEIKE